MSLGPAQPSTVRAMSPPLALSLTVPSSLAKMANVATATFLGRTTAATGVGRSSHSSASDRHAQQFHIDPEGLGSIVRRRHNYILTSRWHLVAPAGSGTVTSTSVTTANGIQPELVRYSNHNTSITLTLGAITPTSIVASGTISGSNLSGTNTGDLQSAVWICCG